MRPLDLKTLVEGLLAVIFFALAIGQFGNLRGFAKNQAITALESKARIHPFFPKGFRVPNN